uniref:G-protein coupled receptors family 3 profile domain-containing protein n=1 Tax=Leptobrachium leishanense TaxID=445787 RepID=A0A8C5PHK9_9ANUR
MVYGLVLFCGRAGSQGRASHQLKVLLCVLPVCVLPCSSTSQSSEPGCDLQIMKSFHEYGYFSDGDVIIGGVLTVNFFMKRVPIRGMDHMLPIPLYYKYLLTFLYAIKEINRKANMLPNVTLGYHLYDSCSDGPKAVKNIFQILSGQGKLVPNYRCGGLSPVAGFIGDQYSASTLPMAQILSVYRYTQISYGATNTVLNDRTLYPTFFRMIQSDLTFSSVLSMLLEHFGWTWVGIITSDDDIGEKETLVLMEYLPRTGTCVAFMIKLNSAVIKDGDLERSVHIIRKSTARIVVICGTFSAYFADFFRKTADVFKDRTLILNPTFALNNFLLEKYPEVFNGSLALGLFQPPIPEMTDFFETFHPLNYPRDLLIEHIWLLCFGCFTGVYRLNPLEKVYNVSLHACSGKERITDFTSLAINGLAPRVFHAVRIMADALHQIRYNIKNHSTENYRYQVHMAGMTEKKLFNENGEYVTWYNIINWVMYKNMSLHYKFVGYFNPQAPEGEQLLIKPARLTWKNEVPRSQCSESCLPGSRKIPKPGIIHSCCYDCVRCSEGEISNITDSRNCLKCQSSEWTKEKRDRCIPKEVEFLSYNDRISVIFSCASSLACLLTAFILGIFILYMDTPIVRANNKNLSFLLLVSIMLSFLCVFLFLGRPVDITCMLCQSSFGIIFTIAVSSVLAKTIMVCIAFKATKPGSSWRKWIGVKVSNLIVLFCTSVQVIINITWLSISPPFQELDTHSYPGKIIVQCNEGSVMAFYSVLGYMGLLAAVSFIIAFLARTLPDSFNEAKYITFSMMVYCSVWIAMIPAYLSTKGKDMVSVEIFAILASSAGLLVCIFLPKCYIVLFRPDLNKKSNLFETRTR